MNDARWPADNVERRKVGDLIPYARNSRTHSDEQVAQIAASIREWGWTVPVLIDPDGGIIAGHGRIMAAQKLGIKNVPCMVADGWTEAQKRAYVIADNQLAMNAGWDQDKLKVEMSELAALEFDLDMVGFDSDAIAGFLSEETEGQTDPDAAPQPPEAPVSRPSDLWILGDHRLLCGDATSEADVKRLLGDVKPHLMVTDPPYGVAYDPAWRNETGAAKRKRTGKVLNDDRADWREAWALSPSDVAYVWHGALHAGTVADSLAATGFDIRAQIVWAKERLVLSRGHYHWRHEPCWYAVRGNSHWTGDRKQSTLWSIPNRDQDAETVHGTQKPVECMRRPILNNSSPGQAVYEPFSGSGTTIIAAETTGRTCFAMELDPAYVDVAVRRWEAFTGEGAMLEGDGQTFSRMSEARHG